LSEKKTVRRSVAVGLSIVCVVVVAGLVGAFAYYHYTPIISGKDTTISSLNAEINQLNSSLNALNAEINQLNLTINNLGELTIQAWSDASYSFGSSKWMFLYEPSFGSSFEGNFSFPFPYFSINPSEAERLYGKSVLITACITVGQSWEEGRNLIATVGASYTWNGLEIKVSEANPAYAVLLFKPLS
jgi:hypothetical protein